MLGGSAGAVTYSSTNGSTGGPWCTAEDGGEWIDFTQPITTDGVEYFGWDTFYVEKIYYTGNGTCYNSA